MLGRGGARCRRMQRRGAPAKAAAKLNGSGAERAGRGEIRARAGPGWAPWAGGAEEREAGEVARADWLRPVRPAGGGRVRRGARRGLGFVCDSVFRGRWSFIGRGS